MDNMTEPEAYDCVVVGAGLYGLAAAKQYRSFNPNHALIIFDSQSSLGGTWADERLYPDLKTNNLTGTFEFPDFPMDSDRFSVSSGQHISGPSLNSYLKAYASHFGISDAIRLRSKVTVAEHQDHNPQGGWNLTVATNINDGADNQPTESTERIVYARRLIVAYGLTSEPSMPYFEGQQDFGGRLFHGKHFQQNQDTLQTAKSVTVFGGHKFAWDVAYSYAKAGVQVDWIIRSSGHGPCWMAPPYVTPLKKWIEKLANIRFLTWFSPCIWADAGGYSGIRSFLHGTLIGRFLVNAFWNVLGNDVLSLNGYDSHPETAKLKPWVPAMFSATSFSILNYDTNFFELVKTGKIKIYNGDIDRLSPGRVHLSDGTLLKSEVLVCNTGWKHTTPIKFFPEGIERELGLPHRATAKATPEDLANQSDLLDRADREILQRFPRLMDQPVWNEDYAPLASQKSEPMTTYMLHRFLVPPSVRFLRHRDVAFCGMISNLSCCVTAHLQSLWISAYFSGLLANDPSSAVGDESAISALRYETVLHNRFGFWRYPAHHKFPAFIFDAVSYFDLLLRDLGLRYHRKQGGFLAEIIDPYGTEDYQDVTDEWEERVRKIKAIDNLSH